MLRRVKPGLERLLVGPEDAAGIRISGNRCAGVYRKLRLTDGRKLVRASCDAALAFANLLLNDLQPFVGS